MYLFKKQGVPWPPNGWEVFHAIKKSCGQAVFKDPVGACVAGLTYTIEPTRIYDDEGNLVLSYAIDVQGWNYSILNESQEFPILSFHIIEREKDIRLKKPYISRLKILSRPLELTENKAHRVLLTALFLIKQIDAKNVPDYERILKLYRIHPDSRVSTKTFSNTKEIRQSYEYLGQDYPEDSDFG